EEDLKSLCKEADKLGISIILDGVFSHTGCDSKYFNMFGNYDCVGAYNSKSSPYFPWYKFIDYPDDYQCWWGIKLLPEVIEENEEYRKYICSQNGILRKWLRCGIRGWRLDVADELPDIFLDDLRKAVKEEKQDAVIIGEVWEDATTKIAYGARRRYLLGKQLDSVMNYPFADCVLNFVKYQNADVFFNEVMSIIENYPKEALDILMNHIGTHDTERAITRLVGDNPEGHDRYWQFEHNKLDDDSYFRGVSLMKIASLVQFTLPGVPSIYYGDEIGMQGMKDPFNRECMQWDNINEELLRWYKRLGEIRNGCSAFVDGEFIPVYCSHKTIAYKRAGEENEVLIAVNLDDEEQELEIGGEWDNSYAIFGESSWGGKLILAPFRYAVLSR
ncbi:MAG: glycoside hydrolase family 13 protein, partial [Eubacterium sp.]|nr:glycoside hydrolase family 13 protein [Eubacterium sp.]